MPTSLLSLVTENIELSILSLSALLLISLSIMSGSFFHYNKTIVIFSIILWAVSFSVYRTNGRSCIATVHQFLNNPEISVTQTRTIDLINEMDAPAAGFSNYGRIDPTYFKGGDEPDTDGD
ncbi:MAG: hypothetical protein OEV64_15240 [Desulfobulbaceae bacterium]|nr:hypothetical protein [Desulfobulbaceae bacterium]